MPAPLWLNEEVQGDVVESTGVRQHVDACGDVLGYLARLVRQVVVVGPEVDAGGVGARGADHSQHAVSVASGLRSGRVRAQLAQLYPYTVGDGVPRAVADVRGSIRSLLTA